MIKKSIIIILIVLFPLICLASGTIVNQQKVDGKVEFFCDKEDELVIEIVSKNRIIMRCEEKEDPGLWIYYDIDKAYIVLTGLYDYTNIDGEKK